MTADTDPQNSLGKIGPQVPNAFSGTDRPDGFLCAMSEALLEPFARAEDARPASPALVEAVAGFLAAQRAGLPHAMPVAMHLACRAMDLSTLPVRGRLFRHLPLADRVAIVARWRAARLSSLRNFVKFHEVFASYVYYTRTGDAA